MFCVATLGPGFTSRERSHSEIRVGASQGCPGPLGVDSRPGRDQSWGEGSQSDCTCRPLPDWEEGRAAERSCRKRKEGRGTQKDLLGVVQAEIPQQAS